MLSFLGRERRLTSCQGILEDLLESEELQTIRHAC